MLGRVSFTSRLTVNVPDLKHEVVVRYLNWCKVNAYAFSKVATAHTQVAMVTTARPIRDDSITKPASCQRMPTRMLAIVQADQKCRSRREERDEREW